MLGYWLPYVWPDIHLWIGLVLLIYYIRYVDPRVISEVI